MRELRVLHTVPSLKDICLSRYAELICRRCHLIEAMCGPYREYACIEATARLKSHLTANLGRLINDLIPKIEASWWTVNDLRLMHAVFLQRWLRVFVFEKSRMRGKNGFIFADKIFWDKQLATMLGLVVLDVRYIACTDRTLTVISKCCKSLEVFRFRSESSFVKSADGTASMRVDAAVSSVGLSRLHRLESLRVVDDANDFATHSIRYLQKFFRRLLPRLENFYHEDIVNLVLDNVVTSSPLPMTHLRLHSVKRCHFLTVLRLCPHLTYLRLKGDLYDGLFEDIAASGVNITGLHVEHFTAQCVLAFIGDFLRRKGTHLKVLILESTHTFMRINEILLFGKFCPNLNYLELVLPISYPFHTDRVGFRDNLLFGNLKSVTIVNKATMNPYYKLVVDYFRNLNPIEETLRDCCEGLAMNRFLNLKYSPEANNRLIHSLGNDDVGLNSLQYPNC